MFFLARHVDCFFFYGGKEGGLKLNFYFYSIRVYMCFFLRCKKRKEKEKEEKNVIRFWREFFDFIFWRESFPIFWDSMTPLLLVYNFVVNSNFFRQ